MSVHLKSTVLVARFGIWLEPFKTILAEECFHQLVVGSWVGALKPCGFWVTWLIVGPSLMDSDWVLECHWSFCQVPVIFPSIGFHILGVKINRFILGLLILVESSSSSDESCDGLSQQWLLGCNFQEAQRNLVKP